MRPISEHLQAIATFLNIEKKVNSENVFPLPPNIPATVGYFLEKRVNHKIEIPLLLHQSPSQEWFKSQPKQVHNVVHPLCLVSTCLSQYNILK